MTTKAGWKWWVCIALLLATMSMYMDRQTLALTATDLKTIIHLDDKRYGILEEWFSYAFAVGAIFFGIIADRIGPRRLYPIVLTGWSIAGIATPIASWDVVATYLGDSENPGSGEFRWLFLCRTMLGFFESGHWPCALLTTRNILDKNDRPFGNSILQSGASLGAVLTPLIIQGMNYFHAQWQVPFVVIGVLGLLWVPFWFSLTRHTKQLDRHIVPEQTSDQAKLNVGFVVFQMLTLLSVVVTISLAWQFHRAWMTKFLREHHHYSQEIANYFTSAYFLVADVGCLFSGYLVLFLTRRGQPVRWARVIAFAFCVALCATSILIPQLERGPWLFIVFLFIGAGSLGAHPQYYALAQELPPRYMATLAGTLSASSWFCVGFMQGRIGAHIKETESYDLGMLIAGAAPIVGLLGMTLWVLLTGKLYREAANTVQNH
jgi:ACS family hexuronate transporter-like MFS transporter